ncbi:MAG TPA: hypothetical protein VHF51_11150 [Solirubrobacteraceae bacterium]|nr:hypothetical protein [Solirubrobacteraceae bacterium]
MTSIVVAALGLSSHNAAAAAWLSAAPGPPGEAGGHPAAVPPEHAVGDCIHAAVDLVQPAGRKPVRDRAGLQTERQKLAPCDDAVLARRQRRDADIKRAWVNLTTIVVADLTHAWHGSRATPGRVI